MNTELLTILKKNIVEFILIISATSISAFVFFLYYQDTHATPQVVSIEESSSAEIQDKATYSIDISGAVIKPDVYQVSPGARMKDVIDLAGGFSKEADTAYVSKNFNLAKAVVDQEKIYIPTKDDIKNNSFAVSIPSVEAVSSELNEIHSTSLISINSASEEELDILPGIGPTTAKKIIENRPYSAINELLTKKTISQSTFNKIQDMVKL